MSPLAGIICRKYPYQCTCPDQIPFYLAYYLHVPTTGSAAYQSSINQDGKVPKTPGPPSLPPVGAMHTFLVLTCTLGQVVHKETAM